MKIITIEFPDRTAEEVDEAARRLGVSVEALVQASVAETLQRLRTEFDDVARQVLEKNAELYRRLA